MAAARRPPTPPRDRRRHRDAAHALHRAHRADRRRRPARRDAASCRPRRIPYAPATCTSTCSLRTSRTSSDQHDVMELWKSAPYLLNFLDGYKLRSRFDAACKSPRAPALAALLNATKADLLDREQLLAYDDGRPRRSAHARARQGRHRQRGVAPAVDPAFDALPRARRRVRAPAAERLHEAARLLRVACRPRAAAGLLSYLAERRLTLEADPSAREHARAAVEPAQSARLRDRRQ